MKRRRKRITVVAAVLGVLVCGTAAVVGRHAIHERWLLNALDHEDASERVSAAHALGELGSLKALPILLSRAVVPWGDSAYTFDTVTRICEKRGPEAIPALIEGLRSQAEYAYVTTFCAERLAVFGPDASAAVPALVEILFERDSFVSIAAMQALRSMGPAARESSESLLRVLNAASPSLLPALRYDEHVPEAFHAASALLHINPGCKEAFLAMSSFLSADRHLATFLESDLREGADRELRRLHLLPSITEVLPAFSKLLGDEELFVVKVALAGLERFAGGDAATVRAVIDLLRRDDASPAAIRFLSRSTALSPEALAAVREGLREGSRTTEFLDQLGEAPPETVSSELIPQLLGFCRAGSDPDRRIAAIGVLGNMGPAARSAVPAIEAILEKEEDLEFESWALSALESIEK